MTTLPVKSNGNSGKMVSKAKTGRRRTGRRGRTGRESGRSYAVGGFHLTLTLSLKGEGIIELRNSYQEQQEEQQQAQKPPAPANLTATINPDGTVTLSRDTPDDDSITGYRVLRRNPGEGEDTLLIYVQDTGSAATTFTDTGGTPGARHVYRVKAINSAGVGDRSNYVNVEPQPDRGILK